MKASCLFLCLKKIGHYFWRRCKGISPLPLWPGRVVHFKRQASPYGLRTRYTWRMVRWKFGSYHDNVVILTDKTVKKRNSATFIHLGNLVTCQFSLATHLLFIWEVMIISVKSIAAQYDIKENYMLNSQWFETNNGHCDVTVMWQRHFEMHFLIWKLLYFN